MKATSGANPHTSLQIKGGSIVTAMDEVNMIKDQGNANFKIREYQKAIGAYTKALMMNPQD